MNIDRHARHDLERAAERISAVRRVYADTLTPGEQEFMRRTATKLNRIVAKHGGPTGKKES